MSAQLEAQIERISFDIERQKNLLKKLESKKSVLQRQLNAGRDPIARLPFEVSSEIFLQCLAPPFDKPQPHAHLVPTLLLNICHAWTDIALSTPALWASISIVFPRARGFENLLGLWFLRAGNHSLRVSLAGALDWLVAESIWRHAAQLENLAISFDAASRDDLLQEDSYDFLGDIPSELPELPRLRELEIVGREDIGCTGVSLHDLLHSAPNLVELRIHKVSFVEWYAEPPNLVLPYLRVFAYRGAFDPVHRLVLRPRAANTHV
ncbi:hypothetical protein FB45DRAFT_997139, partial [Roridomyces roridus]